MTQPETDAIKLGFQFRDGRRNPLGFPAFEYP